MPRDLPLRFWIISLCVLVAANIAVYRAVFAPRVLTISVSDTGKGRAALVRTPGGKTLLIDTGPDAGILRTLGTVLPPWQRSIDAVILTSDKAAQVGGLQSVQSRYSTASVLRIGTAATPYGATLIFDPITLITLTTLAPGQSTLLYRSTTFTFTSSTPSDNYLLR